MIPSDDKTYEFIKKHAAESPAALRLKYAGKSTGIDMDFAIAQIEARQKTLAKLPEFLAYPQFIFPSVLSSEQATNQYVAIFHSSLVSIDENVVDLTAGLGIDAMSMSERAASVCAIERYADYCAALRHNAEVTGHKLVVINEDCIDYLKQTDEVFDVIFVDPARRGDLNSRTYALADCEPDILANMDLLLSKCKRMLVKVSPMLDVSILKNQIPGLQHIYAVSFKNECKELLLEISRSYGGTSPSLHAVIVSPNGTKVLDFACETEEHQVEYVANDAELSGIYLYEPDVSIMKLGAWNLLATRFPQLKLLDKNAHLFVGASFDDTFPGRVLKIKAEVKKGDYKELKNKQFNVVCKDYPADTKAMKKKLGVKDGGNEFLYCTRVGGKPIILRTENCTRP